MLGMAVESPYLYEIQFFLKTPDRSGSSVVLETFDAHQGMPLEFCRRDL